MRLGLVTAVAALWPCAVFADLRAVIGVEHVIDAMAVLNAEWVAVSPRSFRPQSFAPTLRRAAQDLEATAFLTGFPCDSSRPEPKGVARCADVLCEAATLMERAARSAAPAEGAYAECLATMSRFPDAIDQMMRDYDRPSVPPHALVVACRPQVQRLIALEAADLRRAVLTRFPDSSRRTGQRTPFDRAARLLWLRLGLVAAPP